MSINIEISGAVFKCSADENIFYQRLCETAGLEKIITKRKIIYLTIATEQQNSAILAISEVCHIWHASLNICN